MEHFKLAAIAAALLLGACAQAPVQAGYAGPGYTPAPMAYDAPTPLVGGEVMVLERHCREHRYEWRGGRCYNRGVIVNLEVPVGPQGYGGQPVIDNQGPRHSTEEELSIVKGAMATALGTVPEGADYTGQHIVRNAAGIPGSCRKKKYVYEVIDGVGWNFVRCLDAPTEKADNQ